MNILKVAIVGGTCTDTTSYTDCLYGMKSSTSYVYCNSGTCACRTGFTWSNTLWTCECLANKNVTGSGATAACR